MAAGAALSGSLAVPTTAAAKKSGSTTSAEEVGIEDRVRALFENGDVEKARQLLSENDVAHQAVSHQMPAIGDTTNGSSGGVSIQSEWDKSYSTYDFSAYLISGSRYETYSNWDLNGSGAAALLKSY